MRKNKNLKGLKGKLVLSAEVSIIVIQVALSEWILNTRNLVFFWVIYQNEVDQCDYYLRW